MTERAPNRIRQEFDGLTGRRLIRCEICDLNVFRFSGTEREGNSLIVEHALAHVDGVLRRI